jgi:hypothetical protein
MAVCNAVFFADLAIYLRTFDERQGRDAYLPEALQDCPFTSLPIDLAQRQKLEQSLWAQQLCPEVCGFCVCVVGLPVSIIFDDK